jgi:hypothetical protein
MISIVFPFQITHPFHPTSIKPGDAWISPGGKTIDDVIHFAAYAYPTNKSYDESQHKLVKNPSPKSG